MLNLEKLLEYGICKETIPGSCDNCDFDFDYTEFACDIPRPACEKLKTIIWEAQGRKEAKK